MIPEIYFSILYVKAYLLEGEEKYEAANKEKNQLLNHLVYMLSILADYYLDHKEPEKARIQLSAAKKVLEAFKEDFSTQYTKSAYDIEAKEKIEQRLNNLIP